MIDKTKLNKLNWILEIFNNQQVYSFSKVKKIATKKVQNIPFPDLKSSQNGMQTLFKHLWDTCHFACSLELLKKHGTESFEITIKGLKLYHSKDGLKDLKQMVENSMSPEGKLLEISSEPSLMSVVNIHAKALKTQLLSKIQSLSPEFFEKLTVELLAHMGYAGNFVNSKNVSPVGPDGGIDGVLRQDRLGLDKVYVQAKRWKNMVGRPEVAQFVGDLQAFQATKGVFLTTSDFSQNAREYIQKIQTKIALINGMDLVEYMLEFKLGVNIVQTIPILAIQEEFFNEV